MGGKQRRGQAQVGDIVNFLTFHGDPVQPHVIWGEVTAVAQQPRIHEFQTRMLDTGQFEWTELNWRDFAPEHCRIWSEPPDQFYVWQAKRALLNDLAN